MSFFISPRCEWMWEWPASMCRGTVVPQYGWLISLWVPDGVPVWFIQEDVRRYAEHYMCLIKRNKNSVLDSMIDLNYGIANYVSKSNLSVINNLFKVFAKVEMKIKFLIFHGLIMTHECFGFLMSFKGQSYCIIGLHQHQQAPSELLQDFF